MNLYSPNLQRLHDERCAQRRSLRSMSLKLMHRSLAMVGLLAVVVATLLITHPDYARTVGQWMSPKHQSPGQIGLSTLASLDPFAERSASGDRIADRTAEAGRILGLTNRSLSPVEADSAVAMRKVSDGGRADFGHDARLAPTREEREVSLYISRKYRVNNDAISLVVDAAYATGKDMHMDPVLLLAVTAVESGFNPFAESTAGASGLMQLMSKVHRDKLADFGGAHIALNPVANLRVGAAVLKDCIQRGGSVLDGLRLYVGAGNGDDNGYGARVLQERDRILQAAHGAGRARIEPRTVSHAASRVEPIPAASMKSPAPSRPGEGQDGEDKPERNQVEASSDGESRRFASL